MDLQEFKCRACLSKCEQMYDLFEEFEEDLSFAGIIEKFLNIELNLEDGFSKYICLNCGQAVIEFYNFAATFNSNNNKSDIGNNLDVDNENTIVDKDISDDEEGIINPLQDLHNTSATHVISKTVDNVKSKYMCEICGYNCHKRSYLTDHMDLHSKEPRYSCEFCPKMFRKRTALARHRRLHINPKQFICERCGQKFNDSCTLKTHILLLHERTKNFECIICGQWFSLKSTLDKHIKRHGHKEGVEKEFSCTECTMKYYDKSSLIRHYATKHSNVDV